MDKAQLIIKLVRIIAAILIVLAIVLYFTSKEYAFYVAAAGIAIIALINIPLIIWVSIKNEKIRKAELDNFEAEHKDDKK